jgi:hypothetical protein
LLAFAEFFFEQEHTTILVIANGADRSPHDSGNLPEILIMFRAKLTPEPGAAVAPGAKFYIHILDLIPFSIILNPFGIAVSLFRDMIFASLTEQICTAKYPGKNSSYFSWSYYISTRALWR